MVLAGPNVRVSVAVVVAVIEAKSELACEGQRGLESASYRSERRHSPSGGCSNDLARAGSFCRSVVVRPWFGYASLGRSAVFPVYPPAKNKEIAAEICEETGEVAEETQGTTLALDVCSEERLKSTSRPRQPIHRRRLGDRLAARRAA